MNRNSKKYKYIIIFAILITLISVSACNKNQSIVNSESKKPNFESKNTQITPMEVAKNTKEDSINLKNFKELIKLGSYSEIIRLGGERRHPEDVIIKDNKMIFPEGKVITIIGSTSGKTDSFLNVGEDKVKQLISEIEKAKVITADSVKWSFKDTVGASISLVIVNTSAKYIEMNLSLDSKNNHSFSLEYEEPNKRVSNMCIQSENLDAIIKNLTGWKNVSIKDLNDIKKVKYRDLSYDKSKEFELSEYEIKILINSITHSKIKPLEYSCPRNIVIEATKSNGEIINMIWSKEGEGMGIEGVHYQITSDDGSVRRINEILTKYSKH